MLGPKTYRLQWRREMRQRYRWVGAGLALALVAGLVVPLGVSTNTLPVVVGHSVFFAGDTFDPCLASIVGIMRMRVMWFNDMVLVEKYNGDGSYLYVTEAGVSNPTADGKALVGDGIFYDFTDPNGQDWHVQEAYWDENTTVKRGDITIHQDPTQDVGLDKIPVTVKSDRYYTWIVDIHKAQRDGWAGGDAHSFYNFVTVVNTCKFNAARTNTTFAGMVDHVDPNHLNGHFDSDPAHSHETYNVDLWVGKAPKLAPVGASTPNWAEAQVGGAAAGAGQVPTGNGGGG